MRLGVPLPAGLAVHEIVAEPRQRLRARHHHRIRRGIDREVLEIEDAVGELVALHVRDELRLELSPVRPHQGLQRVPEAGALRELRQKFDPAGLPLSPAPRQVVRQGPRLGVEDPLAVPLVVVLRVRVDGEQIGQRDPLAGSQQPEMLLDRPADLDVLGVGDEGAVALGHPFVEPQRDVLEVVVEEVVQVLVVHDAPGIGRRAGVERDVVAVAVSGERPRDVGRAETDALLVGAEGGLVLEDVHPGRDRRVDLETGNDPRQGRAEALEAAADLLRAVVGGVAEQSEMGRPHLDPALAWIGQGGVRRSDEGPGRDEEREDREDAGRPSSHAAIIGHLAL